MAWVGASSLLPLPPATCSEMLDLERPLWGPCAGPSLPDFAAEADSLSAVTWLLTLLLSPQRLCIGFRNASLGHTLYHAAHSKLWY